MIRVLLVEDDCDVMKSVAASLAGFDYYRIEWAPSAEAAQKKRDEFDVVLLDIMLPGMNGVELCTLLRKRYACPIIYLSCLDDSATIVEALGSGGDDYIVKPFDAAVLNARIHANLRRIEMERRHAVPESELHSKELSLDAQKGVVKKGGESIQLLPIECRLLAFLMENEGRYYKAKELYREIWGQDDLGNARTVLVHMHNLRAKIENDIESPRYILNVRGRGYTFCG